MEERSRAPGESAGATIPPDGTAALAGHRGWNRTFRSDRLTVGLVLPAEATRGGPPAPSLLAEHAQLAETLGFAAVWVRDLTLIDYDFVEYGQLLDPWVALSHLCSQTGEIALGVASIVLPIRHPLHVAAAARSIDLLSGGRLLLGLGTGSRPSEYRAVGLEYTERGSLFRESFAYLARLVRDGHSQVESALGEIDNRAWPWARPKGPVPLLLTGDCSQPTELAVALGDGRIWLPHPELVRSYATVAARRRPGRFSPYATLLRIDLDGDRTLEQSPTPRVPPQRLSAAELIVLLQELGDAGVHHAMLDLRWSTRPLEHVLDQLGTRVLPVFPPGSGSDV